MAKNPDKNRSKIAIFQASSIFRCARRERKGLEVTTKMVVREGEE